MTAAVIRATFFDYKPVRGSKQTRLIFEVPIEQTDEVVRTLGGTPMPGDARWVAIALLDPEKAGDRQTTALTEDAAPAVAGQSPASQKGRQWNELRPSAQAALRCKQPKFQQWLQTDNEVRAQFALSQKLGGARKRDLDADPTLGQQWRTLDAEFQAHCIAQGYEGLA